MPGRKANIMLLNLKHAYFSIAFIIYTTPVVFTRTGLRLLLTIALMPTANAATVKIQILLLIGKLGPDGAGGGV
jgi:hypothetical protein